MNPEGFGEGSVSGALATKYEDLSLTDRNHKKKRIKGQREEGREDKTRIRRRKRRRESRGWW